MPRLGRIGSRFRRCRRGGIVGTRRVAATVGALVLTVFGLAAGGPSVAEALPAEHIREAARAELAGRRYQTELPVAPNDDSFTEEVDGGDGARGSRQPLPPSNSRLPRSGSMGDAAKVVMGALIGVGVLLLMVYIANELPHMRRRRRIDARDRDQGQTSGVGSVGRPGAAGPLDEADRLAREGAFGPATHVVLLALVDALHGPIGRRVARSLTGREIVGAAGLAALPGEALSRIVAAAERSHFGGRPTSRADYDACRADYARVVAGLGGPA